MASMYDRAKSSAGMFAARAASPLATVGGAAVAGMVDEMAPGLAIGGVSIPWSGIVGIAGLGLAKDQTMRSASLGMLAGAAYGVGGMVADRWWGEDGEDAPAGEGEDGEAGAEG